MQSSTTLDGIIVHHIKWLMRYMKRADLTPYQREARNAELKAFRRMRLSLKEHGVLQPASLQAVMMVHLHHSGAPQALVDHAQAQLMKMADVLLAEELAQKKR